MTIAQRLAERYLVPEGRIYKFANDAGFDWYFIGIEVALVEEHEAILVRGVDVTEGTFRAASVVIDDWPPSESDTAWAAFYTGIMDQEDGLI